MDSVVKLIYECAFASEYKMKSIPADNGEIWVQLYTDHGKYVMWCLLTPHGSNKVRLREKQ